MATRPKTTRLTGDTLDAPQTTDAYDAPADTYDPEERATSGSPDKATAAAAGHQSVNAVGLLPPIPDPPAPAPRTETYDQWGPDGTKYNVTRNIVTGETTAVEDVTP